MLTAPHPVDEAQRLAALDAYLAFQTGPEPGFDRITSLASRVLGVPTTYVSLVGEETQWLKSRFNLNGPCETTRDIAFCAHAILCDDVLVVPDATADPRFWDNPLVTGYPHVRFYAGCPLRSPSGHNVGTLCAIDSEPRVATPEMLANLKVLAALVVDQLELRKWMMDEESRQKHSAETNYRRLADAIHGMVFRFRIALDGEREHLYASPGAVELLGITPQQYCESSTSLLERVHPDDLESFVAAKRIVLEEGADWLWVGRIVTVGGQTKWVRCEGRSEPQDDGSEIVEGLIIDVTESKEREAALFEAKESAERANLAKSEFLSRMSHELRTPMNAILGFAQMLELEPLGEDAQEDLAQVRKAGEHLLHLINEVLDLSAVDARRVSMSIEPVRLADVLAETSGLLRPLFDSTGVRFRTVAGNDAFVLADRQRLKQIVINLTTNAVKYNRKGGQVVFSVRLKDGFASLDIADEGAGISPEMLQRLFTPFDRLGAEGTGIQGTGLGLSISRGLVELMAGTMSVRSEVGVGSTFTVSLPAVAGPLSALPALHEANAPESMDSGAREVLYVEDNESNILLVSRILRQRPDARLTTVTSIGEALERLRWKTPDVLLLDLNLPDGSGERIVHWVREESDHRDLPIVVLSADATPRQIERVLAAGADDYLTKPLDLPSFLGALDRSIERARS